jgi:hypothetical protein
VDGFRSVQADLEMNTIRIEPAKLFQSIRDQDPVREDRHPETVMAGQEGPKQFGEAGIDKGLSSCEADQPAAETVDLIDQGLDPTGLERPPRALAGLKQAVAARQVAVVRQVDPEFGEALQTQGLSTPVGFRGWGSDRTQEQVHVQGAGKG